ncbi:universal stress protein [Chloroflexi bacterium CFX6]|nr:universal stress protein [Chloroflexi bacterium CFX6]
MKSHLLIATNGFKETWPAVEYGAWFAETMRMKITFLGVTESLSPAAIDERHPLEDIFERALGLFEARGVEYSLEVRKGDAEQVIPDKAHEGDYITVVGPLGRHPFKRWLTGRSIRTLMERIATPILYAPKTRLPLKKMLVSIGGLGYEAAAENLAFQVATAARADVTILHVASPSELEYPGGRDVLKRLDDLAETDTLPGRGLKKGLEIAKRSGLNARVATRQGNVVEEILAEIREGDYDLVCMGSAYSASAIRQLYTPNVTAEVAEVAHCPVLTARYKPV